jgi:hypothetical protein
MLLTRVLNMSTMELGLYSDPRNVHLAIVNREK